MKRFSLHETKNYDLFNFIDSNRDINDKKVKELEASIIENGLLMPVLTNEKAEIIDGQHRFVALRRLGLPVHYVVCNYYRGTKDIVKLQESTRWRALDYCKSLAAQGSLDCKKAIEIAEHNHEESEGKLGLIQTLELLLDGPGVAITSKLKKDEYVINEAPAEAVVDAIEAIASHDTAASPWGQKFSRSLKKMYYKYQGLNLDAIERMAKDNYLKSFSNEGDQLEYLSDKYEAALNKVSK